MTHTNKTPGPWMVSIDGDGRSYPPHRPVTERTEVLVALAELGLPAEYAEGDGDGCWLVELNQAQANELVEQGFLHLESEHYVLDAETP
jgi:hypothetical protein